jgi:hypothetical protein
MNTINPTRQLVLICLFLILATFEGQTRTLAFWSFNSAPDTSWPEQIEDDSGSVLLTHSFTKTQSYDGTTINASEGMEAGQSFCPQGGTKTENNGAWFAISVPQVEKNSISDLQFYYLNAEGLEDDVIVVAPDGFEISVDCSSGFSASLSLHSSECRKLRIYVRFVPSNAGEHKGWIVHNCGTTNAVIEVKGTGVEPSDYDYDVSGRGMVLLFSLHRKINVNKPLSEDQLWNFMADSDADTVFSDAHLVFPGDMFVASRCTRLSPGLADVCEWDLGY